MVSFSNIIIVNVQVSVYKDTVPYTNKTNTFYIKTNSLGINFKYIYHVAMMYMSRCTPTAYFVLTILIYEKTYKILSYFAYKTRYPGSFKATINITLRRTFLPHLSIVIHDPSLYIPVRAPTQKALAPCTCSTYTNTAADDTSP